MDTSRLSACSYPLIERPAEEAFEVIAQTGFTKIDLLGRLPHFSPDPEECDHENVKSLADDAGLQISGLGTYLGSGFISGDAGDQDAELALIKHAIDAGDLLGARTIRVLRGREFENLDFIDTYIAWIKKACEYAEATDITLGIENHGGALSGDPEALKELIDGVGSPNFGLIYDPCSCFMHGGDYRKALDVLIDDVVHVHLKDARTTAGDSELCMLGEGEIDFAWVVAQLEDDGYEGDYALEYKLTTEPPNTGLPKWLDVCTTL